MSSGRLATGVVVGGVALGTALIGTRWKAVERRRFELNDEYAQLLRELRAVDEEGLQRSEDLQKKKSKMSDLHLTIDTLWTDRLMRYRNTNRDLHSYLQALPEALGALKGLTNHYQYMSEEMRKFIGFDIACSKVHHLALLLEHGHQVGYSRVVETLQKLFAAEPLVHVVCESLKDITDVSGPSSVEEASASFTYCMEELDNAVKSVTRKHVESMQLGVRPPAALSEVTRLLTDAAKVDLLSEGQRELAEKSSQLRELLLRERRQLHSPEDVRAALSYASSIQDRLQVPEKHFWLSREDALLSHVQKDHDVQHAVRQLAIWQAGAAAFLMEKQARDALVSYQLLLSETLTKVNRLE